ncbi:hypothetical protein B0H13DRAFT_2345643 [Mycena leptocephala]|nr:hypothetical protein B0H13DRAFT_2345643 [Mycena leptocephala]
MALVEGGTKGGEGETTTMNGTGTGTGEEGDISEVGTGTGSFVGFNTNPITGLLNVNVDARPLLMVFGFVFLARCRISHRITCTYHRTRLVSSRLATISIPIDVHYLYLRLVRPTFVAPHFLVAHPLFPHFPASSSAHPRHTPPARILIVWNPSPIVM